MANPTITIICGACTTAEHYTSLQRDIESRGYPTVCKDPPSITAEDATALTVDDDIAFIRDSVLTPLLADGKDIILLCHSYGGTYGAGAVYGLSRQERSVKAEKGGVIGIIYIASFVTEPGESALQALGMADLPKSVGPGDKPGTLLFTDPTQIWPNIPIDEANAALSKLKPCSASAITTPVSYSPYKDTNYNDAIAYVWAEDDTLITPEARRLNLEKSSIKLTRSINGGHGIDLEAREDVLDVIFELAGHFGAKVNS